METTTQQRRLTDVFSEQELEELAEDLELARAHVLDLLRRLRERASA
jgi:hypothetical protein